MWLGYLAMALLFLDAPHTLAARSPYEHPDFIIQNWEARDGVPENSALAVAQTPDGYLWVGSSSGLLRFNGNDFERTAEITGMRELGGAVMCLSVDRSGRFWVSTFAGMAVLEKGRWQPVAEEGLEARTIAENRDGRVWIGTADGRLFEIRHYVASAAQAPPGLARSGVFLVPDTGDGVLWLANRTFVGRWTGEAWHPVGPQPSTRDSLVAAQARGGGLWVYFAGVLSRYRTDGQVQTYAVRGLDQPREMCEDSTGRIWIASMNQGLVGYELSGRTIAVNATNGLAHRATRYVFEDAERNLWAGTTSGGLYRLKRRQVLNLGLEDGLPDRIVRSVTEDGPGRMLVGTHGGGTARIENRRVVWVRPPSANNVGAYVWSVLHDRRGRTWTGTYGNGLLVETNGVERSFALPAEVGPTVCALYEDSQGRIWVGGSTGLGVIEGDQARNWSLGNLVTNFNVRAIAEDQRTGVLWVGTAYRVLRVDLRRPGEVSVLAGLPRGRVTALALDTNGSLWAGVQDHGLFRVGEGKVAPVTQAQGLPANTVGAMLPDGKGFWWLGTDRGILRVADSLLQDLAQGQVRPGAFAVLDISDGLDTPECTAGFQPSAVRDAAGRLWFATIRGVASVDPGKLRLNPRPPPVTIERLSFTDRAGTNHTFWLEADGLFKVPAGSSDLEFRYAALSYSAPEKVKYVYFLEGSSGTWVQAGRRRAASFHTLAPGRYCLRVKAANNDGVWNETGASFAFSVEPFFWQTLWFRCSVLLGVAGGIGLGGWRLARARYHRQVERLEAQRVLEHERARLAAVMDATSDLVAFADRDGHVLYLNPAGRRLLGFGTDEDLTAIRLSSLFAGWAADRVEREGIPAVERQGTWEAELALQRRDGTQLPVSQVLAAHKEATGRVSFLSTIARDISERKRAEEEKDRLNQALAQAQKMESVGRLAGGVAHDYNNMLQVILGNVELVLDEIPAGSASRADLEEIRKSAQHSAELTRQLLAFARKQAVSPRVLDLNETVGGMLKMLRRLIGEQIQLVWKPGPALWPVKMDPAQIDQIMANLTVNARDAITGIGQVTVRTANLVVRAGATEAPADCLPGDYVVLSVSDNGRGICPEVRPHLFEPFFTTKAFGKGTGLGLATVFGIVKQNRGAVSVESEPGQGTTFRIFLPRVAIQETANGQPPTQLGSRRSAVVLLVEDEPQILALGQRLLEQQGFTVLTADLPQVALDLAARHRERIDLLVTDVVMPGMNGKELRQRVAALHPGLQTLFISGYTADVIADNGVIEAGVEFLEKPFRAKDLIEKVHRLLSRQSNDSRTGIGA